MDLVNISLNVVAMSGCTGDLNLNVRCICHFTKWCRLWVILQPTPPVIKLSYLPPQSLATLWRATPDTQYRQLPDRSGHLTDCNFLTRLLYNDIHWLTPIHNVYSVPFSANCVLSIVFQWTNLFDIYCTSLPPFTFDVFCTIIAFRALRADRSLMDM